MEVYRKGKEMSIRMKVHFLVCAV